jgi:hypothetical protein
MAAATGASLRELMERMGHSSPRAALLTSTRPGNAIRPSLRPWGRCSSPPVGRARARADRARSGHEGGGQCHDAQRKTKRHDR